ncbi:MAG: FTR1 family protein [Halioglobus sp.]
MLINSVILILREVLEAAMLVSVLLALSLNLRVGVRWFFAAFVFGVIGTVVFAGSLEKITDALDGAGQEVANAALQSLVYIFAVGILWLGASGTRSASRDSVLVALMACAVACAMVREGSEILVYIVGFSAVEEQRAAVYAGSLIGAGIGLSLGVLLFATLRALDETRMKTSCLILMSLMAAGMVMQSTMLLEQVDLLPSSRTLWDSSALVSEQSITGEVLYAVFGYESTPSVIQAAIYVACLALCFVIGLYSAFRKGATRVS